MKIQCEHPQIILHPLSGELIARYGNYTIDGVLFNVPRLKRNLYAFDSKKLSPSYCSITEDMLDNCYIANPNTGKTYPLYLQVPCGYCDCCKSSKIASFVHRCELETMSYSCKPLFITLTYDNEHYPKEGVSVRDIQLFFKRFRINLQRKGFKEKIRYCAVAEYGKRTHRGHYHLLVWNLHQSDMVDFRTIRKTLENSWGNGFVMSRFVDPSDNKTFYYTSKYLRKDCIVPEGCNKPFVCSSNRNGGIGSPYLNKMAESVRRTLDTQPKFLNCFNGQVKPLQLSRFVLNKLFPSKSVLIPSKLKKSMRTMCLCMSKLYGESSNFMTFYEKYKKYQSFFSKYFYCPNISRKELHDIPCSEYQFALRKLLECEIILNQFYRRGIAYFEQALSLDRLREKYLVKLFEHASDYTLDYVLNKSYRYRVSVAAAAAREIL